MMMNKDENLVENYNKIPLLSGEVRVSPNHNQNTLKFPLPLGEGRVRVNSLFLSFLLFLLLAISCNDKNQNKPQEEETMNSGNLTVTCEDGIFDLMSPAFQLYATDYTKVNLTTERANARKVMAYLLSGKARVVIMARGYLKDEDSLMKISGVMTHMKFKIADDGLVFFTRKDFPIDTVTASQLNSIFTTKDSELKKFFPKINKEPEFAINNQNSSEYANLSNMVAHGNQILKPLKMFASYDSVKKYVLNKPDVIGIGYLSQIHGDTNFKAIRISYVDSSGKYIRPKPVHQAYIVQGQYPYIVPLWAYLLESKRSLPFWFATFMSKEAKAQKYFLNAGIVPAYAKIQLIPEESR